MKERNAETGFDKEQCSKCGDENQDRLTSTQSGGVKGLLLVSYDVK